MPPSQLKRLKSSLREQGITGPQKSKKQKKASKAGTDRSQRNARLQQIRESFNPFEHKAVSARPVKFASTTPNGNKQSYRDVLHRPGVTKSAGEEMRRQQLLPELQRRNKVGGVVDRRIGEDDPGMTPEEKAIQRFAREKGRKKGVNLFDLEASDEEHGNAGLTHLGRRLTEVEGEDLGEDVSVSDDSDDGELLKRKRPLSDVDEGGREDEQPERKKTKKEVMEEVIAKSKYHKYERQQVKEDDEDLREELDKGMGEILALLQGVKPPLPPSNINAAVVNGSEPAGEGNGPTINPDRQRLLDGMDRGKADKEYESRLRQLAQDTRAKPSDRTKTEEEKAVQEAQRLRTLEEKRAKRMAGDDVSEDDERAEPGEADDADADEDRVVDEFGNVDTQDDAEDFGFAASAQPPLSKEDKVEHEDEDMFALDQDLIASDSEVDVSEQSNDSDDPDAADVADEPQDEEDEFVNGILGESASSSNALQLGQSTKDTNGLAYTYPCPRTHAEFLDAIGDAPVEQLPTIVQRIRALHHPSLSAHNKEAMADFSCTLVDHISYIGAQKQSLAVIEQLIRHLHSLSRTYPIEIAEAFRRHLQGFSERVQPTAGDLVVLTAIGSIYPTSDHFHQVVTPAITLMAKWLGLNAPETEQKMVMGAFLVATCVSYQKLSKRFVPEAVRFTLRALGLKLALDQESLKPHLENLTAMAELWREKTAFVDIISPFLPALQHLHAKKANNHLSILLQQSRFRRRPLELHHHRAQPIRTSIPKFEEGFNPDKHYDPDKERSESRKLQKEYKRERKGAVRELRKDANFIAREQLREKRVRDDEYERKQRRLIAEIQGEEGKEAKEYERDKRRRKAARK